MYRLFVGFAAPTVVGLGAYAATNSIGYGLLAGALTLVVLPPKFDPAIQIKERQMESSDGRTAKERADVNAINKGCCPDCGANGTLLTGPSGGMSQNVLCNSCLMEFNVHFSFGNGALGVDRTGKANAGRARVFGVDSDEYHLITGAMNHG